MNNIVSENINLWFSHNCEKKIDGRKKKSIFFSIFNDSMFCFEKKTVFLHHNFCNSMLKRISNFK